MSRINLKANETAAGYDLYQNSRKKQPTCNISNSRMENTIITDNFFSSKNVDYIQYKIKDEIFIQSGGKYNIGRQSDTELNIIMNSIYLQNLPNLLNTSDYVEQQVDFLNRLVIKECLRIIIPAVKQYEGYRKDISTPRYIMELPKNEKRGNYSLNLAPF